MSVVEVPEWTLEYVKLENYAQKNSGKAGTAKNGNVKSGIKKSTNSVKSQAQTATKTNQNRIYPASRQADEFLRRQYKLGKSATEMAKCVKIKVCHIQKVILLGLKKKVGYLVQENIPNKK